MGHTPEQQIIDQVFRDYKTTEYPLTPGMIDEVQHRAAETDRAATRAKPAFQSGMARVTGVPGAKIPVVYMELGQPTAIAFVDRSGSPWPILQCDHSPGFTEKNPPPRGSHVITLTPADGTEHGSLACSLDRHTNPITLELEAGTGKVDLSFIAQVDELGPFGRPPLYERPKQALTAGDDGLQSFLYGVPPAGATPLSVHGDVGDTKAWRYKDSVYIRTPFVLWSPAPLNEVRLNDVNVYQVQPMPLFKLSDQGTPVDLRIDGARVIGINSAVVQQANGTADGLAQPSLESIITRTGR